MTKDHGLITVHITGHLKDYTGDKRMIEIPYTKNVATLVGHLSNLFPGLQDRIFDDQEKTRPFVNIFVNGTNIRDREGESTTLKEGDTVHILPSVAGG